MVRTAYKEDASMYQNTVVSPQFEKVLLADYVKNVLSTCVKPSNLDGIRREGNGAVV